MALTMRGVARLVYGRAQQLLTAWRSMSRFDALQMQIGSRSL